jgi:hypothetical protein
VLVGSSQLERFCPATACSPGSLGKCAICGVAKLLDHAAIGFKGGHISSDYHDVGNNERRKTRPRLVFMSKFGSRLRARTSRRNRA